MDMLTALQRSGGIEALARQAGVASPVALVAAKQLLPPLLAALRDFGAGRGALLALFDRHGGASLAAEVMGDDPVSPARGSALLAELGVGEADERLVQAILAMLVAGYVSALAAGMGAGPGGIGDLLAG